MCVLQIDSQNGLVRYQGSPKPNEKDNRATIILRSFSRILESPYIMNFQPISTNRTMLSCRLQPLSLTKRIPDTNL